MSAFKDETTTNADQHRLRDGDENAHDLLDIPDIDADTSITTNSGDQHSLDEFGNANKENADLVDSLIIVKRDELTNEINVYVNDDHGFKENEHELRRLIRKLSSVGSPSATSRKSVKSSRSKCDEEKDEEDQQDSLTDTNHVCNDSLEIEDENENEDEQRHAENGEKSGLKHNDANEHSNETTTSSVSSMSSMTTSSCSVNPSSGTHPLVNKVDEAKAVTSDTTAVDTNGNANANANNEASLSPLLASPASVISTDSSSSYQLSNGDQQAWVMKKSNSNLPNALQFRKLMLILMPESVSYYSNVEVFCIEIVTRYLKLESVFFFCFLNKILNKKCSK